MSDFEIHTALSLGRIEEKIDSLAGPRGRISQLEDAQVRHWWFTMAIAPILAIGHAIMRKMGIDI